MVKSTHAGTFLLLPLLVFITSSCSNNNHTIKIKGSDTEVNLAVNLAEQFSKADPSFSISVSGGGSGLGITSLMNGQADMANSSRPLTDQEKLLFQKKDIRLKTIMFAEDATAFVVHKDNPLVEIDIPTLGRLLSGEIVNWKSVSPLDLPVNIYGRQSSSGTYSFVKERLNISYSPRAKEMTGNAQILESIKMDRSGIGYVGAGYISQKAGGGNVVRVLKIKEHPGYQAVSPLDPEAIKKREYFFQRPLYQFIPLTSWKKVKPFIEYETRGTGRQIIENSGYYLIE